MNDLVARALGEHGYLFQHRCLEEISQEGQGWFIEAEEYPVAVGGTQTSIDFILRPRRVPNHYLIFECKRAHPGYVTWLFSDTRVSFAEKRFCATAVVADSPYSSLDKQPDARIEPRNIGLLPPSGAEEVAYVTSSLEVNVNAQKKSQVGKRISQPKTIHDACKQVLTGVAGIASERVVQLRNIGDVGAWVYTPIVVTTAKILVSKYSVENVGLATGTLAADKVEAKEVGWVFFDFPLGQEWATVWIPRGYRGVDPGQLRQFKSRSVVIINATSLMEFLERTQHLFVQ